MSWKTNIIEIVPETTEEEKQIFYETFKTMLENFKS